MTGISTEDAFKMDFLRFLAYLLAPWVLPFIQEKQYKPHFYELFGTKTAYDAIRSRELYEVNITGCSPVAYYLIARHGTRFPNEKAIQRMLTWLPLIRDEVLKDHKAAIEFLGYKTVERLNNWIFPYNREFNMMLAPTGAQESKQLGGRLKLRFPNLFKKGFERRRYDTRYTSAERTKTSAHEFLRGLFGFYFGLSANDGGRVDDNLLRFYMACNKCSPNSTVDKEDKEDFLKRPEFVAMLKRFAKKLHREDECPSEDIVLLVYDTCRYEMALHPQQESPWCAFFTPDDFALLEYAEDLKLYYKVGYGYPSSYKYACLLLKDIYENFRNVINGEMDAPVGYFRFSHSGLLLRLYSILGLFRDPVPPSIHNYAIQRDRQWRSSFIDAFNSNLGLALFECKDRLHRIMAFHQEREIPLPHCRKSPCLASSFFAFYEDLVSSCDANKMTDICHGDPNL